MSTRHNQNKFLLSLVIGMIFLITISANCLTARAEDSSQIIIKESSEHTIKPVVRPSRENINTKYKVKVGPVKIIKPKTQNQDLVNRTHGATASSGQSSKYKTEIKIIPIKETSSELSESLKGLNGEDGRQRLFPERSGIAGKIQKKSISISVVPDQTDDIKKRISKSKEVTVMPIDQTKKGDKKFEAQVGPVKVIDGDGTKMSQASPGERVKVTRVRAWKLDESGRKTNEKIRDDTTVIEGVHQPPAELNK